jgi:hypothetical protein
MAYSTGASQAASWPGLHATGIRQTLLLQRELIDVDLPLPEQLRTPGQVFI